MDTYIHMDMILECHGELIDERADEEVSTSAPKPEEALQAMHTITGFSLDLMLYARKQSDEPSCFQ